MTSGLDSNQLMYLTDVLGLNTVVLPHELKVAAAEASSSMAPQVQSAVAIRGNVLGAKLVCLVAALGDEVILTGEADSLAEKMIRAMKVDPQSVAWIEWNRAGHCDCPAEVVDATLSCHVPVICFGEATARSLFHAAAIPGQWVEWSGVQIMVTHSLSELIAQPEKKKTAWAHLQAVMKVL